MNCHIRTGRPAARRAFHDYRAELLLAAFGVSLITLLVFLPALQNRFVMWDDNQYIIFNPYIRSFDFGLFRWAFLESYASNWHPLTWISLAMDYAVWGPGSWGFHLTNIILHCFNTIFVFFLTASLLNAYKRAAGSPDDGKIYGTRRFILVCSLVAGLFFGLHPLRVESVAWAAERKDVLNAFFGLPALLTYIRFSAKQTSASSGLGSLCRDKYYLGTLFLFILSLLSKPMTVMLPVVFLIIDWFPLQRLKKGDLKTILLEKAPFFILSFILSIITVLAQNQTLASAGKISLLSRGATACKSTISYLRVMIWPSGLSPFYMYPTKITLFSLEYVFPLCLTALITFACLKVVRHRKIWLTAWLCYLVMLSPILGILQVGGQEMADRYTYLPSIGPTILVSIGISLLYFKASASGITGRFISYVLIAGIICVVAVFSVLTVRQIGIWKNTITLWSRVIEVQPMRAGRAYFCRGEAYTFEGEYEKALQDMTAALEIAEKIKYNMIYEIYFKRAEIYQTLGYDSEALNDYTKAIAYSPGPRAEYYYQRGLVLRRLGRKELSMSDFIKAEKTKEQKKADGSLVNTGGKKSSKEL